MTHALEMLKCIAFFKTFFCEFSILQCVFAFVNARSVRGLTCPIYKFDCRLRFLECAVRKCCEGCTIRNRFLQTSAATARSKGKKLTVAKYFSTSSLQNRARYAFLISTYVYFAMMFAKSLHHEVGRERERERERDRQSVRTVLSMLYRQ